MDFHLHTPGVSSFAGLAGVDYDNPADQRRFAEQYAQRLHDVGIELAAITDYHGIRQPWFDLIKESAAQHGIVVLPGAELNLNVGRNAVHILAVFPADTDPQEINECLRGLSREPGKPLWNGRDHSEIDLGIPVGDAMRRLRDRFGCLLFAAHAEDRKGIVEAMGPKPAADLIAEVQFDGVDHASGVLGKLRSTGVAFRWDQLAMVEFSDPRRLADVGGKTLGDGSPRGTWLKLSATDLDAMRLALHDPQTRVRTTKPSPPWNGRIVSAHIEGRGFLGALELTLDAHLNTLIGGRGTGKSAVLETIRYALDITPFCDAKDRQRLVDHALGSGGSARLRIERHTESGKPKQYEVRRALGEPPHVIDLDTGAEINIAPEDTFGPNQTPIVLLQGEIDTISKSPEFRRKLLDQLIGDDLDRAEAKVTEVRRNLSLNSAELRKHRIEQGRRPDIEQRVDALAHELQVYEDNGVLQKLATHRRHGSIGRHLGSAGEKTGSVDWWSGSLTQAEADLVELADQLVETDDDLTQRAATVLTTAAEAIRGITAQVADVARAAHDEIRALRDTHAAQVEALTAELNEVKQLLHADNFDATRPCASRPSSTSARTSSRS
ncbi:hypothetical protein AB0K00_33160 [Dactylosporangium sp. NPDC049525]|uniref:hypothetical protein n=1 Tax=Dactylosporangium sp. NPDC049525 TaxID=3154730 RepID=UPI003449E3E8